MSATIVAKTGPVSYTVETAGHGIWKRHVDQLLHASGSLVPQTMHLSHLLLFQSWMPTLNSLHHQSK